MPTNPFIPNPIPRSSLTLWRWLFFEPILLEQFEKKLSKSEKIKWFLKAYVWILLIYLVMLVLRAVLVWWIVQADLPTLYPTQFNPTVIEFWQTEAALSNSEKFGFLFFSGYTVT